MSLRLTKTLGLAALLLTAVALFAFGGNSGAAGPAATPVASSACGALQYGGQGAPEAIVVSDLPLQGDSKQRSLQMNDAIRLVLEGANWRAGSKSASRPATTPAPRPASGPRHSARQTRGPTQPTRACSA